MGFCGNITYKNAQSLRDTLVKVSVDQLVLETDAPWLSPQVVRGTINTPANIHYLYTFVADYLQIDITTLTDQLHKNFKQLYRL